MAVMSDIEAWFCRTPAWELVARRAALPWALKGRRLVATSLPFADDQFDSVVCFLMLHHTLRWQEALGEAARVTHPEGLLVGYDLADSMPARLLHRLDRSPFRLITQPELEDTLGSLPFDNIVVEAGWGGLLVRFAARRHRSGRPEEAGLQ